MDKSKRKTVMLLGPSMEAVSGVSTHLINIFKSDLKSEFNLIHFKIGREGQKENLTHRIGRFFFSPILLFFHIIVIRPALIHLNTSMNRKAFWRDLIYLFVAKFLAVKTVYQVHGGELPQVFYNGNKRFSIFLRKILRIPDSLIVLSKKEKLAYENFGSYKRLVLIPNAIELKDYKMSSEKDFNTETLKLVYIGRIAFEKGLQNVIISLSILKKEKIYKKILFEIAGTGPAEARLKKLVFSLGVEKIVNFRGALFGKRKMEFWREAQIFVFPTFHDEGLPYAIIESLASGTPMITTRVGGIPDAVEHGVHGIFIEPHNSVSVAHAIRNMEANRILLKKMSLRCVEKSREIYDIDRLFLQIRSLYKSLLLDTK